MIPEMMIDWRLSSWGSWQAMNCCFVVSWKETPGTESTYGEGIACQYNSNMKRALSTRSANLTEV